MIFPSPDPSPPRRPAGAPPGAPPGVPDGLPSAVAPAVDPAGFLASLFETMIAAADPGRLLPAHMPAPPAGRTVVVGAGKAAAAMAQAVEEHWPAELTGLVVTRYGHGLPGRTVEVVEAGHPLPDSAGSGAAARILELVGGLSSEDLVLVLLSGGGSALLTLPAPGLSLADVKAVNQQLLRSGAAIAEINCVRKHLSAISGGRLAAAAWPAQVLTFAISDVPGDDPAVIASGPTVGDPSTFAEALQIAVRYSLDLPPAVWLHLERAQDETPKPGDPRLDRSRLVLLATPDSALEAAAEAARAAGLEPLVIGSKVQGEAREVAREHAALVGRLMEKTPLLILSGGETTVTVKGGGRGGRNTEYLLSLALALEEQEGAGGSQPGGTASPRVAQGGTAPDGALPSSGAMSGARPQIYALAADTDGIDGTEDNAGAYLRPDSLVRARAAGLDAEVLLAGNDSYGFFAILGDLVITGPTRTNVNDFRAILAV